MSYEPGRSCHRKPTVQVASSLPAVGDAMAGEGGDAVRDFGLPAGQDDVDRPSSSAKTCKTPAKCEP